MKTDRVTNRRVGRELRLMAAERKLFQGVIAKRAQLSQPSVSRAFKGEGLTIERVSKVLDALGADWADLFRRLGLLAHDDDRQQRDVVPLVAALLLMASVLGPRYNLPIVSSPRALLVALIGSMVRDEDDAEQLVAEIRRRRKREKLNRT